MRQFLAGDELQFRDDSHVPGTAVAVRIERAVLFIGERPVAEFVDFLEGDSVFDCQSTLLRGLYRYIKMVEDDSVKHFAVVGEADVRRCLRHVVFAADVDPMWVASVVQSCEPGKKKNIPVIELEPLSLAVRRSYSVKLFPAYVVHVYQSKREADVIVVCSSLLVDRRK